MGKEQISIRLEPEILQKIDNMAGKENRTRNNMGGDLQSMMEKYC
jgi:predicted transcriptional regulator